jgi:hypothetical protein
MGQFILMILDKNITLTPFTIYYLIYLFNKNNLNDMIYTIEDLKPHP